MAVNYTQYSYQLYGYLMQLKQTLAPMADDPQIAAWIAQIDEQQTRITTHRFQVAVLGEFKRGKSSFINTLLGREILPADALPTTATINRVVYGDHPRALLRMKNGQTQAVAIDDLASYVTKLNGEAAENAARIEEAVVEYPSMFCRNDVELIDTPGLNDDEEMTHVTISRLKQIDLAIVAISAAYPFSETETDLVAQLLETPHISQIIFVVTMIDKLDAEDRSRMLDFLRGRIAEKVRQRIEERHAPGDPVFEKYDHVFRNLRLYGLSSKYALRALKTNDMQLFAESGYQHLNEELPQLLVKEQAGGTIRSTLGVIQQIAYDFNAWPQKRIAALQETISRLAAFKPVVAQKLYGAVSEERKAWERACDESMLAFEQQIDACRKRYAEIWNDTQGSDIDRAAALMRCMADQFGTINQYLLNAHMAGLRESIEKETLALSGNLTGELNALLADMPQLTEISAPLLAQLDHPLAWPEDMPAPALFHWSKFPVIKDVLSPEGMSACPADAQHPYIKRTEDALRFCADSCCAANRQILQALLDQLENSRKLAMQGVVMAFFKAAGASAAQIQAEIKALSDKGQDPFATQLADECRRIRECFEADLARS